MTSSELARLTNDAVDQLDEAIHEKWRSAVESADVPLLVDATARLTSNADHRPAKLKAYREAIISEIERKNTEHLATTMEKLDASAAQLSRMSLWLAVVGVVVAALQLLQAFKVI